MSGNRVVFVDRDGTLIEEPPDEKVDRLGKIKLLPGVIPALIELRRTGFGLVMVTNQDGLGTAALPTEDFETPQRFVLDLFASQGVEFDAVFVCPHVLQDGCGCRKPKLGMIEEYLRAHPIECARSFMVGDRDTDLEFAGNLGITGLRVCAHGNSDQTWPSIAARILGSARRARIERRTKETQITLAVDLSREGPSRINTSLGFFDHMLEQIAKHGGFALELDCMGDLRIDEHHTVEDCALALGAALREAIGDKLGIARYGFVLPMDEAEAQVAIDLSGRPYFAWEGRFERERIGDLPTELVPHFFRSLAETLGAALHIRVRGENTHHMVESCFKGVGRSLRQAIRREGSDLPSTKGLL
jgi:imidazoleglycerol-phosphate dehydratase / histidinol-phosphatase